MKQEMLQGEARKKQRAEARSKVEEEKKAQLESLFGIQMQQSELQRVAAFVPVLLPPIKELEEDETEEQIRKRQHQLTEELIEQEIFLDYATT
jgi:hypothetical protein